MDNIQNIFDNLIPQLQENGWMDVFDAIAANLPVIPPIPEQEEEPTE